MKQKFSDKEKNDKILLDYLEDKETANVTNRILNDIDCTVGHKNILISCVSFNDVSQSLLAIMMCKNYRHKLHRVHLIDFTSENDILKFYNLNEKFYENEKGLLNIQILDRFYFSKPAKNKKPFEAMVSDFYSSNNTKDFFKKSKEDFAYTICVFDDFQSNKEILLCKPFIDVAVISRFETSKNMKGFVELNNRFQSFKLITIATSLNIKKTGFKTWILRHI